MCERGGGSKNVGRTDRSRGKSGVEERERKRNGLKHFDMFTLLLFTVHVIESAHENSHCTCHTIQSQVHAIPVCEGDLGSK